MGLKGFAPSSISFGLFLLLPFLILLESKGKSLIELLPVNV
jgi:hypothetical protein